MALSPQEFEKLKQLAAEKQRESQGLAIQPGRLKETGQDIKETVSGVIGEFRTAGETITETFKDPELTFGQKTRGILAESFRRPSRAFGEAVIGAGKALLPQRAEEAIATKVGELGEKVGQTKFIQDLVSKYQALPPETKREVDNILGVSEGLAELLTFGVAPRFIKPIISAAIKPVKGVITTATTAVKETTKRLVSKATPKIIKDFQNSLGKKTGEELIEVSVNAYKKAVIENKTGMTGKIKELAGEQKTTPDELIRKMVVAGVQPTRAGNLMDFTDALIDIGKRQDDVIRKAQPLLANKVELTSLDSLKRDALARINKFPLDSIKAKRELDRFFEELENSFGKTLSAEDVNEISVIMNKRFKDPIEGKFIQDTANEIGRAARKRVDEIDTTGLVREANRKWGELQKIKETIDIFNDQTINVGFFGEALGRYAGVLVLAGIGGGSLGAGGLVVAGLAAKFGGDAIASMLRNKVITQQAKTFLVQSIKRDEELVQRLIAEAAKQNKEILERTLLGKPTTIFTEPSKGTPFTEATRVKRFEELGLPPEGTLLKKALKASEIEDINELNFILEEAINSRGEALRISRITSGERAKLAGKEASQLAKDIEEIRSLIKEIEI